MLTVEYTFFFLKYNFKLIVGGGGRYTSKLNQWCFLTVNHTYFIELTYVTPIWKGTQCQYALLGMF